MTPRYVRNVGIQTGSFSFSSQLNSFCPPPQKKTSPFHPSSHNKPILITAERGREEGEGAENWKRETSKSVWDTHGFLTLGHSNWSICSLLNWFCPKKIPPFYPASHNKPFLITAERERRKKGALGHSNWTTCSLLNGFYPAYFSLLQKEEGRSMRLQCLHWKWEKGPLQNWMRHRGFNLFFVQQTSCIFYCYLWVESFVES